MKPCIPAATALAGALLAVLLAAGPAAGADDVDLDKLRLPTVMIEVTYRDDDQTLSDEGGSGVLVCYAKKKAWVLTARHVLYGERRSTVDLDQIKISFYNKLFDPVVYNNRTYKETDAESTTAVPAIERIPVPGEKDLMLLAFHLDGAPTVARPGEIPADAAGLQEGAWPRMTVQAVGWPIRENRAAPWTLATGHLQPPYREGGYLFHDAPISDGFSGGPLFDDTGALIGINLGIKDGSRAQAIDSALQAIKSLVDAECNQSWGFRSETEIAKDLVDESYRKAMEAFNVKRWDDAERYLREAKKMNETEGGSVHLQGMRYTTYLPHYYLGLALLYRGHTKDLSEALYELRTSENQREVRQFRGRYRTLQRKIRYCERAINEENLEKVKAPASTPS